MFKVGQRIVTVKKITAHSLRRVVPKGSTGVISDILFNGRLLVKIDGDKGFTSQDGAWSVLNDDIVPHEGIFNKDVKHILDTTY